ncbi:MAG: helix-turn-helix transcriptional regulator [Pseudomonadota bacterium]
MTTFLELGSGGPSDADSAVETLILRVGARVRKARQLKNMPRRVLSDISGVSPRYLAQLEAGEGNISIGLLQRVAISLDLSLDRLLGDDDPWASDALRVADLFRAAAPDTRRRVLDCFAPELGFHRKGQRICLVGLRGAGKSTLGEAAGARLGLPFIELNREIESRSGMPVSEVMALYGQEGYRTLEAETLAQVAEREERVILAAAGGIVGAPDTYAMLLERFHTVWLKTTPEQHMERVRAQGDTRPMAGNAQAMDQLRAILEARAPLYARADTALDTSAHNVAQSLEDLLRLISSHRFLETS